MTLRLAVAGAHMEGFSGIPRHLIAALREHAAVSEWRLPHYQPSLLKRVAVRAARTLGSEYLWEKEPARCAFLSRAIDDRARSEPVDAVLVIGSESCAYCQTAVPLFGFGDSIFGSRLDLYEDQRTARISERSIREGIDVQQRALDRMRRFFITSRWAWDRAVEKFGYRFPAGNVRVTLVGANLPHVPDGGGAVGGLKPAAPLGPGRFAWVGVDWRRKRGELAVQAVRLLREKGVEAKLDVVGVDVPPAAEWMHVHGRLSAETGLGDVYAASSALLLPTAGDLTPIVIAEAAMYGRATFASRVGGIPEMIDHGTNGVLIDSDDPRAWADALFSAMNDLPRLGAEARRAYDARLNWPTIARGMVETIVSAR